MDHQIVLGLVVGGKNRGWKSRKKVNLDGATILMITDPKRFEIAEPSDD